MDGATVIRILLGVIGGLMLLAGAASLVFGVPLLALYLLVGGGVLVVIALVEVSRYRSESAERLGHEPGPGGGETAGLEARFLPTDETFIDPTTRLRMRVFHDPRSGERRYVAEPGP